MADICVEGGEGLCAAAGRVATGVELGKAGYDDLVTKRNVGKFAVDATLILAFYGGEIAVDNLIEKQLATAVAKHNFEAIVSPTWWAFEHFVDWGIEHTR